MMEKAVLSLTTSQDASSLSLSIARLKRTELDVEKDSTTKALLQVRHDPFVALPFIAQSFVNGSEATSSTLFVWLAKDQSEPCLEALRQLLSPAEQSTSTGKPGANKLRDLTIDDQAGGESNFSELSGKEPFRESSASIIVAKPALVVEANKILKGPEASTPAPPRLRYHTLLLLSYSVHKLPMSFLELTLPILAQLLLTFRQRQPTSLTLLARDLFHYTIWKFQSELNLFQYRLAIRRVIMVERDWAAAVGSDCLAAGLSDLISVLDYVIRRCQDEEDSIMPQEPGDDAPSALSLLQAEANQLLARHWSSCGLLLAQRSTSIDDLRAALNLLRDGASDVFTARLALRDACLTLGRIDLSKLKSESDETMQHLLEGSMRALRDVKLPEEAHRLAAVLIRTTFSLLTVEGGMPVRDKLIPLLDEKDGISKAAVELVAEMLLKDPPSLAEIQTRLGEGQKDPIKRETALQVLSRVIELRCRQLATQSQPNNNDMDERLAKLLLAKLGDDKVNLRNQAARAFVALPPTLVIPKICAMLTDKDEKKRSAASEALCHCLAHHVDLAAAVRVLLELPTLKDQDAALQLTVRWVTKIDESNDDSDRINRAKWTGLIQTTVELAVSRAGDAPQLIGFARRLAPFVSKRAWRSKAWLGAVLKAMKEQNQGLSGEVYRITPLLLLRVLPEIDLEGENELLRMLSFTAFSGTAKQSQDVRRTALEVLARVRGSLPWSILLTILVGGDTKAKLVALVPGGAFDSFEDTIEVKRAAIYGCCHSVMSAMMQQNAFGEDVFPLVAVRLVFSLVTTPTSAPEKLSNMSEKDEEMLVMGATEFLTLAMVCSGFEQWVSIGSAAKDVHSSHVAVSVVEELEPESQDNRAETRSDEDAGDAVLDSIWNAFVDTDAGGQFGNKQRVLAMSVLCSALRSLLPSAPHHQEPQTMTAVAVKSVRTAEQMTLAAFGLARVLMARTVRGAWSRRPPTNEDLFLLFTCAFVASSTKLERPVIDSIADLARIINVCIQAVREREAFFLTALKLIGVLLTLPAETLARLPDGTLGRIQSVLRGAANLDPLPDARKLAGDILALSFH